jgi:RNA polymerase sigma factor for flagellar operon FliA
VDRPAGDVNEPEANLEGGQMLEALAESIESLPEREKTIVSLYYVEEMNLREIGAVLDISESRVSQVLTSTIKQLRQKLAVD